jgi:hypothetical protein
MVVFSIPAQPSQLRLDQIRHVLALTSVMPGKVPNLLQTRASNFEIDNSCIRRFGKSRAAAKACAMASKKKMRTWEETVGTIAFILLLFSAISSASWTPPPHSAMVGDNQLDHYIARLVATPASSLTSTSGLMTR